MKILVIFTGGTIGSTVSGEYISTDGNKPYVILEKYNRTYPNSIEWVTDSPYTILSENVTCKTYGKLFESIKEGLKGGFDGIIITHGSDTLQYSAAFLSMIKDTWQIPIMLVSSNYVLEDERANGMENFRCAVDFIQHRRGQGVFVPYANRDEECKIHWGFRLMDHIPYSDYLFSMNNGCYGFYRGNEYYEGPDKDLKIPDVFDFVPKNLGEGTGILRLDVCPGMKYPMDLDDVKVILLQAYHGGTICVESKEFMTFIAKAKSMNIPVCLVGANKGTEYDSCKVYKDLDVIVLPEISPVYAYIRLWLANLN